MQAKRRIKTLNDLRRHKYYLRRQLRLRAKILDLRIRRFEEKLTIPNITREMFRGSKLEYIAPVAASYLAGKVKSGKDLLGLVTGFFAGFGAIFKVFKRKKAVRPAPATRRVQEGKHYNEDQMFI